MTESVYIHVPFCKSKCKYCSFVSVCDENLTDLYIDALLREITAKYNSEPLKTLYFGGGTPSLLSAETVEKIIQKFILSDDSEITFEINPDDADLEYLKGLKSLGVNRLSFGVQTFNDEILTYIGRRHDSKTALDAIDNAKSAGFTNISIDLIYGLPFQTEEILKQDLNIIKTMDLKHISTYGLKIENPSYFYKNPPESLPDDDLQADMYLGVNEFLENISYKRYEISNFAKTGYESRHNLNYWNNAEYYGFGAAAHGYQNGVRYSNTNNIQEYVKNPLKHFSENQLSEKEKLEEEIFLGFRREKGINVEEINKNYNIDFIKKYENILKKYIPEYIIRTETGYKFTLNGVLLSNNILAEFIDL